MPDNLEEIREAIDNFELEQARSLLRTALQENPTAEVYYLSSQVAVSERQKVFFLEKAIDLDPFHQKAHALLTKLKNPPVLELSAAQELSSQAEAAEPVSSSSTDEPAPLPAPIPELSADFSMGKTLLIVFLGFSLAGVLVGLENVVQLYVLSVISYSLAGTLAGATTAYAVEQLVPSFRSSRSRLILGWTVGWFFTVFVSGFLFRGMGVLLHNLPEAIIVATVTARLVGKMLRYKSGILFGVWFCAYMISVLCYYLFPSTTAFLSQVIGNVILGVIGCYAMLRVVNKSLAEN